MVEKELDVVNLEPGVQCNFQKIYRGQYVAERPSAGVILLLSTEKEERNVWAIFLSIFFLVLCLLTDHKFILRSVFIIRSKFASKQRLTASAK